MKDLPDSSDFEEWIDNRFDLDPMIFMVIYQIYLAQKDQRLDSLGIIVDGEDKKPISNKEIMKLENF